ncbi:hypothetical protein G9P44_001888 [Scheffersomyces stipitis]|nr:hypothetical protein G9P44_001888 [Scheffersomyces stipitis]
MAKKTLAEQIAELTAPKTDFDIEDNDLKQDVFANENEESGASDQEDDSLRNEHYVAVSKSKLREKNSSVNLGKKYNGSVASRSDLYGDGDENDEEDEEDEDDDELEENEDEENDSDSGVSLSGQSDSEIEGEEESDEETQDLQDKRSRLKSLMSQERSHIVNRLSQSATNDSLKGFAISQQHSTFDKIIDARLKIQKSITNANLLPPNSDTLSNSDISSKKTSKYLSKAKEDVFALLESIMSLRSELLKKDNITAEPVVYNPRKRSLEEFSNTTEKFDSILDKFRSGALTKWSAKVQNASGATAINAGKFKSINQSFEQQVSNNLADMERLVKRTKLNRRQISPLGYEYYKSTKEETGEDDNDNDEEDENPDIPREQTESANKNAEIDEIFDDEDFYRVLLNDLVDKKIQSSDPTSGMTLSLRTAQKAHKMKKNIDTKASKGRKLKFQVQEQIANFETPRESWRWDDNQIDEFFASLLGQKVNMNEIDEQDNEEAESEDEPELLAAGEDTITLFG